MTRRYFSAVLICSAALFLIGCARSHETEDGTFSAEPFDSLRQDLGVVEDFSLQERSGKTVRRDDLLGKVWVASFFFTCCTGDCGKTSASMAHLQKDLARLPDVRLVSFSVYPENDTAEVLTQYAKDRKADADRWLFLTGDDAEKVRDLIQKGFKQTAVKGGSERQPGNAVDHSFNLVVVDHRGRIRGYIDGRDPENLTRLEGRVRDLIQAKYLPSINAALNGTCAVLLAVGYLLIRGRFIRAHKVIMLSALTVSAVFLASYLYYHFAVLRGEPTRFTGEGWVRPVYYGVLLSHTVLAVVVAPLALTITYLGLRNRLVRHVRLARWTLPLWIYVSVTGVVVYWMLYQLYPLG
jgi:protein SCO1/2/putative membrane protein